MPVCAHSCSVCNSIKVVSRGRSSHPAIRECRQNIIKTSFIMKRTRDTRKQCQQHFLCTGRKHGTYHFIQATYPLAHLSVRLSVCLREGERNGSPPRAVCAAVVLELCLEGDGQLRLLAAVGQRHQGTLHLLAVALCVWSVDESLDVGRVLWVEGGQLLFDAGHLRLTHAQVLRQGRRHDATPRHVGRILYQVLPDDVREGECRLEELLLHLLPPTPQLVLLGLGGTVRVDVGLDALPVHSLQDVLAPRLSREVLRWSSGMKLVVHGLNPCDGGGRHLNAEDSVARSDQCVATHELYVGLEVPCAVPHGLDGRVECDPADGLAPEEVRGDPATADERTGHHPHPRLADARRYRTRHQPTRHLQHRQQHGVVLVTQRRPRHANGRKTETWVHGHVAQEGVGAPRLAG
mmetsp:Transcript_20673/g.50401  ORF Transcript_20673/g.50401 Transcript_20673/m.50401 type:complete len:406 (-) Transcript_20673:384-1601(-)